LDYYFILPPSDNESTEVQIGQIAGFSLHAGIMARRDQRKKLERLCHYICRPSVSEERLAMTSAGEILYQLKTPYRDGTTHVFFQPLDFIACLTAFIPKPRVNLTRYHGMLAPNSHLRALVTPAHLCQCIINCIRFTTPGVFQLFSNACDWICSAEYDVQMDAAVCRRVYFIAVQPLHFAVLLRREVGFIYFITGSALTHK
jgi:hypothetical protein